jgi:hypothetical protein
MDACVWCLLSTDERPFLRLGRLCPAAAAVSTDPRLPTDDRLFRSPRELAHSAASPDCPAPSSSLLAASSLAELKETEARGSPALLPRTALP